LTISLNRKLVKYPLSHWKQRAPYGGPGQIWT